MYYDIKRNSVQVIPWVLESGQYVNEDTYANDVQNLVAVEVETVDCSIIRLVHVNTFLNDAAGAERLAQRVEDRGYIDADHWGYHGFISMDLEARLAEEALAEDYARRGYSDEYNGPCAGGHE